MVVKSRRGRRRYVAFEVRPPGSITFDEIAKAIESEERKGGLRLKLIEYRASKGIVRCLGPDTRRAKEFLAALGCEETGCAVKTVRTSGTLLALREALGLPKPPPRRRPEKAPSQGKKRASQR